MLRQNGLETKNYQVVEVRCGDVTITPKPVTLTFTGPMRATYNGSPLADSIYQASINGLLNEETHENEIEYTFYQNEALSEPVGDIPVNAGEYWVKAVLVAKGNYGGAEISGRVVIDNATEDLKVSAIGYGSSDCLLYTSRCV